MLGRWTGVPNPPDVRRGSGNPRPGRPFRRSAGARTEFERMATSTTSTVGVGSTGVPTLALATHLHRRSTRWTRPPTRAWTTASRVRFATIDAGNASRPLWRCDITWAPSTRVPLLRRRRLRRPIAPATYRLSGCFSVRRLRGSLNVARFPSIDGERSPRFARAITTTALPRPPLRRRGAGVPRRRVCRPGRSPER